MEPANASLKQVLQKGLVPEQDFAGRTGNSYSSNEGDTEASGDAAAARGLGCSNNKCVEEADDACEPPPPRASRAADRPDKLFTR